MLYSGKNIVQFTPDRKLLLTNALSIERKFPNISLELLEPNAYPPPKPFSIRGSIWSCFCHHVTYSDI